MRKRIEDMSPQELLKASETFEALFDLVHQHDDNSIENTNPDYYKQELARRDEIIKKLKEDGERLASEYRSYDPVDEIATCVHCGNQKEFDYILAQYFYSHTADCPITLHRELMKELEGE
jgi:predicted transcriptional regulator YheO